jgi:hypothetical protein
VCEVFSVGVLTSINITGNLHSSHNATPKDSKMDQKLKTHVDQVLASAAKRREVNVHAASEARLLERLDELIAGAADEGLASVVFWHGVWWNYTQAKEMRGYLAQIVEASEAKQD